MPQRRGRRSAGNEVAARAQQLADDLLTVEETCFAEIDKEFDAAVDPAARLFVAAWTRARQDPALLANDRRFVEDLTGLHADTLAATRPPVAGMAGLVRTMALESIGDELDVCESTLAKRFVGLTEQAVRRATERSEELVTDRLADYETALGYGQDAFARLLAEQTRLASGLKEDQDRLAARLFAPTPNRLPGNGGRGIWWRTTGGLHRSAREVSIRLASVVRLAAMQEFNAAGEDR